MTLRERLNPFHARRVTISTPCRVPECVERLRADVAPYWTWGEARQGMKGTVKSARFELQRRVRGAHGYVTEARGRIEACGRGSLLDLTLGWGRLELLSRVWEIAVAVYLIREVFTGNRPPAGVLALLILSAILPGIWSLADRVSRAHDDDWLVARLCELLDGSEIPRALD